MSGLEKPTHLAMAVVIRNGTVLIQERYRKSHGRVYEFPGGSVDANENAEQAATRELYEETGLKDLSVLGVHTSTNEYGGDIYYVVLQNNIEQEPKETETNRKQKFYWLQPQNIPRKDFYRADLEFIDMELEKYTQQ